MSSKILSRENSKRRSLSSSSLKALPPIILDNSSSNNNSLTENPAAAAAVNNNLSLTTPTPSTPTKTTSLKINKKLSLSLGLSKSGKVKSLSSSASGDLDRSFSFQQTEEEDDEEEEEEDFTNENYIPYDAVLPSISPRDRLSYVDDKKKLRELSKYQTSKQKELMALLTLMNIDILKNKPQDIVTFLVESFFSENKELQLRKALKGEDVLLKIDESGLEKTYQFNSLSERKQPITFLKTTSQRFFMKHKGVNIPSVAGAINIIELQTISTASVAISSSILEAIFAPYSVSEIVVEKAERRSLQTGNDVSGSLIVHILPSSFYFCLLNLVHSLLTTHCQSDGCGDGTEDACCSLFQPFASPSPRLRALCRLIRHAYDDVHSVLKAQEATPVIWNSSPNSRYYSSPPSYGSDLFSAPVSASAKEAQGSSDTPSLGAPSE
eukprot:gene3096-3386_t